MIVSLGLGTFLIWWGGQAYEDGIYFSRTEVDGLALDPWVPGRHKMTQGGAPEFFINHEIVPINYSYIYHKHPQTIVKPLRRQLSYLGGPIPHLRQPFLTFFPVVCAKFFFRCVTFTEVWMAKMRIHGAQISIDRIMPTFWVIHENNSPGNGRSSDLRSDPCLGWWDQNIQWKGDSASKMNASFAIFGLGWWTWPQRSSQNGVCPSAPRILNFDPLVADFSNGKSLFNLG